MIDGQPVLMLPAGLVNRLARYLQAAAALVNDGVVPDGGLNAHPGAATVTILR